MVLLANVLIPLYIYPLPNAWNPLFTAIKTYPQLSFTVIVNPNSGPGTSLYPDANYISGVKQLNTYSNVQTVGYVHTSYTTRPIADVLKDISIYSGWDNANKTLNVAKGALAVKGIFFDETPNTYTAATWNYLHTINAAVKSSTGFLGAKTVIHNPGTIVDARLSFPNLDVTVVCENTYQGYLSVEAALNALKGPRSTYAYTIHDVPTTITQGNVTSLSQKAQYLFLTTLSGYTQFDSFWTTWTRILAVFG